MKTLRVLMAGLVGGLVVAVVSCTFDEPPPKPPVPRGWVSWDTIQECLGAMARAPMPVHYLMPVDEAFRALGEPHGELKEMFVLRQFSRVEGARAYYWHFRESTLYVVVGRRSGLVENMVVVDDVTNVGQEVILTREEILSARIKPGMGVGEVYKIMGRPDRIDGPRVTGLETIDRFWYESPGKVAPPVSIDIDRTTFKVVAVSTAPVEEMGPPPDAE
jgi:hypothetical protein